MRIANIIPPDLLEPVLGGDPDEKYHLILASLVRDHPKYQEFYKSRLAAGDFVILDNDAYEEDGVASPLEYALQAFAALVPFTPHEVVLPDIMYGKDCARLTIERSAEAVSRWLKELAPMPSFVAIPHGNTMDEWLRCAMQLSQLPNVKTLGIAEKDAIKLAKGDRGKLVRAISGLKKRIHLFGMMEDMSDIQDSWVNRSVRGVDGSKLVVWGLHGTHVVPENQSTKGIPDEYPGRSPSFFETKREDVDEVALRTVRGNIRRWREYAERRSLV